MQRSKIFMNYFLFVLAALSFISMPSFVKSQEGSMTAEELEYELEVLEAMFEYEEDEAEQASRDGLMSLSFLYPPSFGPGTFELSNRAEIFLPAGYSFRGEQGTMLTMELMENTITGREVGMIMSELETEYWYAVFSFEDIGYISDRDKSDLNPKKLLEWVEKSLITHNQARLERG